MPQTIPNRNRNVHPWFMALHLGFRHASWLKMVDRNFSEERAPPIYISDVLASKKKKLLGVQYEI